MEEKIPLPGLQNCRELKMCRIMSINKYFLAEIERRKIGICTLPTSDTLFWERAEKRAGSKKLDKRQLSRKRMSHERGKCAVFTVIIHKIVSPPIQICYNTMLPADLDKKY